METVIILELYNCHSHTLFSHDGKGSVKELCLCALKNGLSGFAVTDHCDCEYASDPTVFEKISLSFRETKKYQELYKDRLTVSAGVEIGEALYNPEFAEKIISSFDWDVILGSVHAVRIENLDMPFSVIDFSVFSDEQLHKYISRYFSDMLEMLDTQDFDVLCHLTVVLRYIVYKYNRQIDLKKYYPVITEILRKTVNRDIALEINTSGLKDGYLLPDREILRMYKALGGKKLTTGSDSHIPENLACGLREAAEIIKSEGFDTLTFYSARKPIKYKI